MNESQNKPLLFGQTLTNDKKEWSALGFQKIAPTFKQAAEM
jgi:hypothetical protein